ncbi:DNA mismatch repair protein Msh2 [Bacillus rossius redtenbacheri]|uniref:DNA mismatch repair protein Msh2 n=1 Tax=Bacillus rossius redtenbacheri TaxID=93214 RepID=UPI002FDEB212
MEWWGVALVDAAERRMCVCEFPDDDHFSSLEALVVQTGPKECLLPSSESSQEYAAVKKVVERSSVLVTPRKKAEFGVDSLFQDLNRLIAFKKGQQENSMALPETTLGVAVCSLAALIKYLELVSDASSLGQYSLSVLDWSRYVHMDAAAVRALSLLPPPGATAANAHHSLLGLLDRCRTPQGHRLLAQWLKQPLRDANAVRERQDVVGALLAGVELRQALSQEHLRRVPDFQALARRLLRGKASMQDLYRIYQAVKRLPALVEAVGAPGQDATLRAVCAEPLRDLLRDMAKFQDMVESTLDLELVDRGEFLVKASFDEDLQEMRSNMDSLEERIRQQHVRVAAELAMEPGKTLKLESSSQLGYFLRVTLKEERAIRGNKAFQTIDTNKSGVRFRTPALSELNAEYLSVRARYAEQQKAIVSEITTIAAGYVGTLQQLNGTLAQLDVLTSFAEAAASAPKPYVRPELVEDGAPRVMSFKQLRHPCLEVQEGVSFIANDVHFQEGERVFSVITGPNMGGKSTYIRSVGCAALLAQVGSFVPCDEARLSLVDAVLARVGADDCQLRGMSTFMMEMVETAAILRMATSNSLVIIDELGRGTSTFEGCGLAWAIAEHLAKEVKAFCLFATHFHELTELASCVPAVVNQHVSAITACDTLTLLYRVLPGACDQSFGVFVARTARFPPEVVEMAKKKQAELEFHENFDFNGTVEERKKIIEEGERVIREFLDACRRLQGAPEDQVSSGLAELRAGVAASENPYVRALLAAHSEERVPEASA